VGVVCSRRLCEQPALTLARAAAHGPVAGPDERESSLKRPVLRPRRVAAAGVPGAAPRERLLLRHDAPFPDTSVPVSTPRPRSPLPQTGDAR